MTPPLFLAVEVPETVALRLAARAGGVPGARWMPAETLHVTLRYLGERDPGPVRDLAADLDAVGAGAAPFDLAVDGVGCFEARGRPRLIHATVAPHAPLASLRARIEAVLRRHGVAPDRRGYRPHVTLARLRDAPAASVARFLEDNAPLASPPFAVAAFTLFESLRGHGRPIYRALRRYPLAGAPVTPIPGAPCPRR